MRFNLQVVHFKRLQAEAAIHAMRKIFEQDETDAVVLVDASNAFNRLHRQVALHNIQIIAPSLSTVLINTYRLPSRLFVTGGKELLSKEGTTQGDNLAMAFYGLSTIPLQNALRINQPSVKQVWLADDATGAGSLQNLREWWNTIITRGSQLGYYVNETKSWIILKDNSQMNEAKQLFKNTDIQFSTAGKRHLGASIGSDGFREEYANEKVAQWSEELEKLTEFAQSQPHAAFAAYIHGEHSRFSYFMRTIPGMDKYMKPLDDIITEKLLPTIFGSSITEVERELFSLPIRDGGMGISVLTEEAKNEFTASTTINAPLVAIMILQGFELPDEDDQKSAKREIHIQRSAERTAQATDIEEKLPPSTLRAVQQAKMKGASSWLAVRPSTEQGFTLNKSEFRDALAIRYDRPIKNLPSKCPCGQAFTITHAMNCKKGGFVTMRHNDIRDFEANLLSKICNDVEIEPPLQPVTNEQLPTGSIQGDDARLDVRARGFWRKGQNAYFDVRVTKPDAPSPLNLSLKNILSKHEREKKRQYNHRIMNVEHGLFTPLVFSVNGSMGPECTIFHQALAEKIATKTGEQYPKVLSMMRCKISYIIIRSAILC